MRQILLMMVLVALVGCGKKEPAQPSASKPEPTKDNPVYSSPAIGSDGVYVGSNDGRAKLWEFVGLLLPRHRL